MNKGDQHVDLFLKWKIKMQEILGKINKNKKQIYETEAKHLLYNSDNNVMA